MVEFLVRRERKLDVKADVAVRRLARLEKEQSQLEDEESEASFPDALADRTKFVKLVVDKWFVDKGFGFGKVHTSEVIFIHASVVRGAEVLMIGSDAWVQVVRDDARAQGSIEHASQGTRRVEEERDKERASKVAEQVRRVWEKKVSEVCSHPPGLHDAPAKTGNVTDSPFSLAASSFSCRERQFSQQAQESATTQEGSVELNHVQPLAPKKSQPCLTKLGFYVKAIGKDESLMRGQFTIMKLGSLRKERDHWRTLAVAKQRLQDKKEEAWEPFQRQRRLGAARREEFERAVQAEST